MNSRKSSLPNNLFPFVFMMMGICFLALIIIGNSSNNKGAFSENTPVPILEKTGIVERYTQGKNANGYDMYSFKIKNDPAYYEGDSYHLYQHECELMKSGDSVLISYKDNNFDGVFDRNHDQMIHFKNYSLSKQ